MSLRPVALLFLLALALAAGGGSAEAGKPRVIVVKSDRAFAAAVERLRRTGGTIILRPHRYRKLVIGPRSWRPLRIVGTRGVRVGGVVIVGTQRVSLGRLTIAPVGGDARVDLYSGRHILLHDLVVTAAGTRFSASIRIRRARNVTIRGSTFTHCGDRSRRFVNCIELWRWSHDVLVAGNHFHDCRGCDFVHGRFGTDLTIRNNRFERALPCAMNRYRCGHNDLVQLFAGRRLRVVRNHFGVYRSGGAQLYLTNAVDYATIVNNVFVGADPRVPGYRARVAIVVGSKASQRMPHYARVINNTILTGVRRRDGYEGSIRMSSRYGSVERWKRPVIANNVIALLNTPNYVCSVAGRYVRNLVIRGRTCSRSERVGPLDLDGRGRPRARSPVIDSANRHFAPRTDVTGRRRSGRPDVGAFEYRRG